MRTLRKILSSLISFVKSWRGKEVPGVADTIRKTQLKQDHQARQNDMQELLRMVQEGRLHEADERQLENLKLALELNNIIEPKQTVQTVQAEMDPTLLVEAVKQAIAEGMSGVTVNTTVVGEGMLDPSRPQMKHTSLADLAQDDTRVDISHKEEIRKEVEGEESTDKLAKLRKIKGGK